MRIQPSVVLCLLFSCATLCAAEKPWTEIRSAHFRLITDGEDSAANRVLLHFELMRAVFEAQSPNFKLETPAPLLILAPKDEASAKRLLPWRWAHPGTKPAGMYMHGWEREYALVRLDVIDADPEGYQTVYHEYVHNVLHINFQGLPAWLDEGLGRLLRLYKVRQGQNVHWSAAQHRECAGHGQLAIDPLGRFHKFKHVLFRLAEDPSLIPAGLGPHALPLLWARYG